MSVRRMENTNGRLWAGGRQGSAQQRVGSWLAARRGRQTPSSRATRIVLLACALVASCVAYVAYFSQGI